MCARARLLNTQPPVTYITFDSVNSIFKYVGGQMKDKNKSWQSTWQSTSASKQRDADDQLKLLSIPPFRARIYAWLRGCGVSCGLHFRFDVRCRCALLVHVYTVYTYVKFYGGWFSYAVRAQLYLPLIVIEVSSHLLLRHFEFENLHR